LRINKYVSETGKASRRGADKLIQENRVKINGKTAKIGDQVKPGDKIIVDGERLNIVQDHIYIALNKPVGVTCTGEKSVKKNIIDLVNLPIKINHVGRLDKDSEGLILLSDDGDFIQQMTHPRHQKVKRYIIELDKALSPLHRQMIVDFGVSLKDGVSKLGLVSIDEEPSKWEVIMSEGRNRQIRRTFGALGYTVVRLKRVQLGKYNIGNLKSGEWEVV